MDEKRIILKLLLIPVSFLCALAFAWIPMLAWNYSIATIFDIDTIGYWQAFWLVVALDYILIKYIPYEKI